MTDNKIEKIRAEIEEWYNGWKNRLYNTNPPNPAFFEGGIEICKHFLSFIDFLQEEPESIWHDIEELSIARECEYILVIYKDTTSPRVAGNKTQVSYWDRVDKWAYLDDLLKF